MIKSPNVQHLKASFEAKAAQLADLPIPNVKHHHDTSAAKPNLHPSPAARQAAPSGTAPSWIGPMPQERYNPLSKTAVKLLVRVEFTSPGLQPPVYICSSLTDPKWQIIEMNQARNERGENCFSKDFSVEEGEYQYKIRLGPGDWWVIDDSKPTVDDGMGNRNNLVVVRKESNKHVDELAQPASPISAGITSVLSKTPAYANSEAAVDSNILEAEPSVVPYFSTVSGTKFPDHVNDEFERPSHLPHETVMPSSYEQRQAPLFRHETIAIDNMQYDPDHAEDVLFGSDEPLIAHDAVTSPEMDPGDKILQRFPTNAKGIHEEIANLSRHFSPEMPTNTIESAKLDALTGSNEQLAIISEEDGDESQKQDVPSNHSYGTFERAVIDQGQMTPPLTPKADYRNGVDGSAAAAVHSQPDGSKAGSVHASLISIA
jgi:hypothetical protein